MSDMDEGIEDTNYLRIILSDTLLPKIAARSHTTINLASRQDRSDARDSSMDPTKDLDAQ